MRHHLCINCARYEPKERDGHCIAEYDLHTDIEDPEIDHCTEWVSMKHRPAMALREGISALSFILQNGWLSEMPVSVVQDRITQIIAMLERGLRK